jgi:hypothetical protein
MYLADGIGAVSVSMLHPILGKVAFSAFRGLTPDSEFATISFVGWVLALDSVATSILAPHPT